MTVVFGWLLNPVNYLFNSRLLCFSSGVIEEIVVLRFQDSFVGILVKSNIYDFFIIKVVGAN